MSKPQRKANTPGKGEAAVGRTVQKKNGNAEGQRRKAGTLARAGWCGCRTNTSATLEAEPETTVCTQPQRQAGSRGGGGVQGTTEADVRFYSLGFEK